MATTTFSKPIDDEVATLNSKLTSIGTINSTITKNAVSCPNNGTTTKIGSFTLTKGQWIIILTGWSPLGDVSSHATIISTGYPFTCDVSLSRVFNLTAYASIADSSKEIGVKVTNWESSSITAGTAYELYAIKVSA